jgi:hypothetical protein
MLHNLLQFIMDPRFLFVFGIAFFGGFAFLGDRSSAREGNAKPQEPPAEDGDGPENA